MNDDIEDAITHNAYLLCKAIDNDILKRIFILAASQSKKWMLNKHYKKRCTNGYTNYKRR